MRINFQQEALTFELWHEVEILARLHRDEVGALNKEKFPLKLNLKAYELFHEAGALVGYTGRTQKGLLVGYIVFIIQPMLHYSDNILAQNDVVFLHPIVRKGLTGYRFLRFAINQVKECTFGGSKVDCVQISMKVKHQFQAIAERLGFCSTDILYHMEV